MRTRSRAPRGALVFFIVFLFRLKQACMNTNEHRERILPGGAGPLAGWLITLDERTESAEGARSRSEKSGARAIALSAASCKTGARSLSANALYALKTFAMAALNSVIVPSGSSDVAFHVALNRFISSAAASTAIGLSIAAGLSTSTSEDFQAGTSGGTIGMGSMKEFEGRDGGMWELGSWGRLWEPGMESTERGRRRKARVRPALPRWRGTQEAVLVETYHRRRGRRWERRSERAITGMLFPMKRNDSFSMSRKEFSRRNWNIRSMVVSSVECVRAASRGDRRRIMSPIIYSPVGAAGAVAVSPNRCCHRAVVDLVSNPLLTVHSRNNF